MAPSKKYLQFAEYHSMNPRVYQFMTDMARDIHINTTIQRVGAQFLIESCRYENWRVQRNSEFKIQNDFAAFYGRLIMMQEPDLYGFIRIKPAPDADIDTGWLAFEENKLAEEKEKERKYLGETSEWDAA